MDYEALAKRYLLLGFLPIQVGWGMCGVFFEYLRGESFPRGGVYTGTRNTLYRKWA